MGQEENDTPQEVRNRTNVITGEGAAQFFFKRNQDALLAQKLLVESQPSTPPRETSPYMWESIPPTKEQQLAIIEEKLQTQRNEAKEFTDTYRALPEELRKIVRCPDFSFSPPEKRADLVEAYGGRVVWMTNQIEDGSLQIIKGPDHTLMIPAGHTSRTGDNFVMPRILIDAAAANPSTCEIIQTQNDIGPGKTDTLTRIRIQK
ncbi:MAG: hypothetical protein AAB909_04265 [Patescibacteria group bacterium]